MSFKFQALPSSGSISGWPINNAELPLEESSIWTCIAVKETKDIDKPKFTNPNEMEKVDVLRFLFGKKDPDGKISLAQTKEMRMSSFHKSALVGFVTSFLGKAPPMDGTFTTDDLVGRGAQITISHMESRRGTKYAAISGIGPVASELQDKVTPADEFEIPGDDPKYNPPTSDQKGSGTAY